MNIPTGLVFQAEQVFDPTYRIPGKLNVNLWLLAAVEYR